MNASKTILKKNGVLNLPNMIWLTIINGDKEEKKNHEKKKNQNAKPAKKTLFQNELQVALDFTWFLKIFIKSCQKGL